MATVPQYNFTVTQLDLEFILKQIKIAEGSSNPDGSISTDPVTGLAAAVGSPLLPYGLRTVDGTWNSLLPGQERVGAADSIMPRLVAADLNIAALQPAGFYGPGSPAGTNPTSYAQTTGAVFDYQPRIASNLISDQTVNNPAAVAAALQLAGHPNPAAEAAILAGLNTTLQAQHALVKSAEAGIIAAGSNTTLLDAAKAAYIALTSPSGSYTVAFNAVTAELTSAGLSVSANGTIEILNQSPDIGLSPAFNGWMTIFGQFFDHGLDLVTKGGNGTVYIPLLPDDPLYVAGSNTNFMVLTRATQVNGPGADGVLGTADDTAHESINTTTPFIDQNQTYTSHPSHQVFLREYAMVDGKPLSTGHLLDGAHGDANWGETKAHARDMLGIQLVDMDVHNVPLLATDRYGEFIRGPNGFAQMVVRHAGADGILGNADDGQALLEGSPTAPISTTGTMQIPDGAGGFLTVAYGAALTDHAFLNDIARNATPGFADHDNNPATPKILLLADADDQVGSLPNANYNPALPVGPNNEPLTRQPLGTYDNELLDRHIVTGDGRGNENIGLTTVHTIFHSEHNRLVEDYKQTILASGDLALINEWLLTDVTAVPASSVGLNWDGERLFQAGRFVTEMQYQHLVFEEFARAVQPAIDPFIFSASPDIDPAIVAEFAHVVYRFGHSMLNETIDRIDFDMNSDPQGLIAAFLNPLAFDLDGAVSSQAATGAIVRGLTRQTGNEIDEFVTEALRNNLVGLPLDLPTLNMARARETGMPSFNEARAAFFAASGDSQLEPFTSWADMAPELKNPTSIINFIAAYGTHTFITSEATLAGKRAAAMTMVFGGAGQPADATDFLNGTGAWNAANSGLNDVDLWIGGLAERKNEFGGMLGATFNYVFENQLESLQNGDRFYYLSRTQGTNMLNELENNTFSKMIMRNTDLGTAGSSHVSSLIFQTPDYILEVDQSKQLGLDPTEDNSILQILNPKVVRHAPTADVDGDGHLDGGYIKFHGGEHVVLGGTVGNDTLLGSLGIDTLWGDGGNDRLDGGNEADQVHGGDGDDIITDAGTPVGGADFLHGDEGNDVISSGMGNDIVFGGGGSDFIITGNDFTEVFAGRGDDFILGGNGSDGLLGNEGDDWIEGGEGFDGLSGENSELFFNSPIIGHDVLNGQGNDTDYDGESGDDIMVQTVGITRSNGMFGFDWGIHKGDEENANSDLGIPFFPAQQVFTLRDRFDSVEGLSGWKYNDILTGASILKGAAGGAGAGPGNPVDESALKSQNVSLIKGFAELLGGTEAGFAAMAANTTVLDTTTGAEIIIGGGGSDVITGNLGNDILDGDAWLNVRISVRDKLNPNVELFSAESMNDIKARMLTGEINPGQLKIVRELLQATTASSDVDTAVYRGLASEYTIVNANGTRTITHNVAGALNDGVDTIRNFERIQFADQTIVISGTNSVGTGTVVISDTTPTEDAPLTVSGLFGDADFVNLNTVSYTWEALVRTTPDQWITLTSGPTFTPGDAEVGLALRVRATFIDGAGVTETVYSAATAPVANINDLPVGLPVVTGTATEDQVLSVVTSGITDPDGLGTFSYAWTRNGVTIAGAAGASITLGDADVSSLIRSVVSYTDGHGTLETLTSAPTAAVANINDAPVLLRAQAALAAGQEDITYVVSAADLLDGFTDPDAGDVMSVINLQASGGGTVVDLGTGFYQITQAANFNGTVNLTYSVTDGHGGTVAATQSFNLTAVNDAPVGAATAVLAAGTEDTAYTVSLADLLAGFSDVDGDTLSVSALTSSNGAVAVNLDGSYTITPTANYNGPVSLTYTVGDGHGGTVTASQSYSLTATPDATVGAVTINNLAPDLLRTLTVSNSLSDPDGALSPVTYQWQSSPNGTNTWSNIVGATGASFTTDTSGVQLRVVASYSVAGGPVETMTSTAITAAVGAFHIVLGTNPAGQTLNGTIVADQITGLGGNDRLNGLAGDDILNGGAGSDVLTGGSGNDTMIGGLGNDTYVVSEAGDVVTEAAGEGTDTVWSTISYALTANVESLVLSTAIGNVSGTGNALNNLIIGNSGDNVLDGGAGNDNLQGGLGNDTYVVSEVGDTVSEGIGAGTDAVYTSLSTYTLGANLENLAFTGTGMFQGTGNALNNQMLGGTSGDLLRGGAGNDTMSGGFGNDTYIVTETGDVVVEGLDAGLDTVWSTVSYTLSANVESLVLSTAIGNVSGTGNGLNNLIIGNSANNTINGGAGRDTLTGNAGSDTFLFSALSDSGVGGALRDVITDFLSGTDRIDLSALDANAAALGNQAFTMINTAAFGGVAGQLRYGFSAGTTIIEGDVDGNGIADFQVQLTGTHSFVPADILL